MRTVVPLYPPHATGPRWGLQVRLESTQNVGNERLQAEGAADKSAGAVQKNLGDAKEAAKTLAKKP